MASKVGPKGGPSILSLTFHTRNEAWLNFSANCEASVKERTLKLVTDLLSWESGANVKVS